MSDPQSNLEELREQVSRPARVAFKMFSFSFSLGLECNIEEPSLTACQCGVQAATAAIDVG